ncbi:MAG: ACT domain-containing protein [Microthrixaceae bacterium]
MPGQTDLEAMLATLSVERRPGRFTLVHLDEPVGVGNGVHAVIVEAEGTTAVASVEAAVRRGWSVGFDGAWLTLQVQSSLEAVGLTATVAAVLADRGIACNVLAGYFHDHLIVPTDRAEDALDALAAVRR